MLKRHIDRKVPMDGESHEEVVELINLDIPRIDLVGFPTVPKSRRGIIRKSSDQYKIRSKSTILPYQNLLVVDDRDWDANQARRSLRSWATKNENIDVHLYRKGFMVQDGEPDRLDSYKFPIATILDNKLVVPLGAIVAAVGQNLPLERLKGLGSIHLRRYYRKLGEPIPDNIKPGALARVMNSRIDVIGGSKDDLIVRLAKAADVTSSHVTQILRGEIRRPPDSQLRGFADVLEIPVTKLMAAARLDERKSMNYEQLSAFADRLEEGKLRQEFLGIIADLDTGDKEDEVPSTEFTEESLKPLLERLDKLEAVDSEAEVLSKSEQLEMASTLEEMVPLAEAGELDSEGLEMMETLVVALEGGITNVNISGT